ncbi:MAG: hypothetical protein KatS3mg108_3644 [Isosphaeraceae bacterium]|jgi:hypothetical protein|nr:MAG: hypothetical protein KatS3mg108_3644 [Isosphaeraceae bacterium]
MSLISLIALLGFSGHSFEPMSLNRLLEAHQHYVDRIQSLEATWETYESRDGGSTWTMSSQDHWWKDGPRERYTSRAKGFFDLSGSFHSSEIHIESSFSPDETRYLSGWNRERPPSSLPSPVNGYHMADASIGGPTGSGSVSGRPPYLMMLAATLEDYLPDAVRKGASASVRQIPGGLWEITFEATLGTTPLSMGVALDPRRGFALARREVRPKEPSQPRGVWEITEYQEVAPGLFIPTRIRIQSPDQPGHLREIRVTTLKVNKPLPAESLTLEFPEGMKVHDTRSGAFHIWGSNGPRQTFPSREEFLQYERAFFKRKPPSTPLGIYAGASLALAATLGWLVWLRRRLALRGPAA